jgi:Mrp family chromosome partitioning ATPase/capsular polysaccharide biosynthesis protein
MTQRSTLREYLDVLRRRRWIVLIPVIVAPVLAIALTKLQTPTYSASAEVLLGRQGLASGLNNITDPLFVDPQRLIDTQINIAQTPQVAAAVLKAAHLKNRTPGEFLGSSSASPMTDADVMVFTVHDRSPQLASRLATLYAQEYIKYANALATGSIRTARNEVEAKMGQLESSGDTTSAVYTNLATTDEQLVTMETLQAGNASLLRAADGAGRVQSSSIRNGLLGLLIGLVIGVGLAFLFDHLDTRVRDASEVSHRLGLPLLARLPEPSRSLRRGDNLVMVEEPTSHEAEPYRVLLTNLEFVSHEVQPRSVMVTSAREGEGKSTTAANLAVTLARAGKRVALIDLDLRRPFLHEFFHIPPEPGLTTMAVGRASLQEALVPVALESTPTPRRYADTGDGAGGLTLDLVCSGAIPPNPGEFIRSPGVGRLIEHLSETHDIVIIDAAPLLGLGDSLVLIPRIDAVLLVARLELLRRPMLDELHRVLESTKAPALGIIVTAADREQHQYGYGYSYGYGYGYGQQNGRHVPDGRDMPVSQGAEHEVEHT